MNESGTSGAGSPARCLARDAALGAGPGLNGGFFARPDERLRATFDALFRARAGESGPVRHRVASLPVWTYHYKIGGNAMTGSACAMGTITVVAP